MRSFEKVLPLAFATAVGRRRVTAVLRRSAWVLAWLILLVHTNQGAWAASDGSGFIPGLEAKRPTNGPGVLGSASGLVGASRAEIELIPIGPGIWVEKLQGSAAVAHLGNLMAKRPDAFSEAGRSMREKGYNPTDVVYVERMIQFLPVRGIIPGAAIIPAEQYSESDGNAEIVYWSWDNGDDSTWEGTIYVEIYEDGAASLWQGQIDASTSAHLWIWYEKVWSTGPERGPIEVSVPGGTGRSPGSDLAVSREQRFPVPELLPVGWKQEWAECHRTCVIDRCATAAAGCVFSGPKWPLCFGVMCNVGQALCAWKCYNEHKPK